jgi:hypothetical protein
VTPRLATVVLASALIRRVNNEGGHATVLAKGDAKSGSILLLCADRGRVSALRERLLTADGSYAWQDVTPVESRESGDVSAYLERRRARDPDIWIIELDVPNAERFAAETSGDD